MAVRWCWSGSPTAISSTPTRIPQAGNYLDRQPHALSQAFDRVMAAMRSGDILYDALLTHGIQAEDLAERIPGLIVDADSVLKAIAHF